ncbi:putative ABC transport system permease protein [Pedobacter sp. W3I1]|uniref:ABC transporter permease n=1 Tax=Pedobacter sp. W3I1 TaxID=3042291 RepID=UPI00277DD004|nr:FtsX-like permease family protein [Pedobacter sp. W3I1]MDQ0640446.1 putative ABC transport system permease protein [Pedobacter sp. W3I1]
MFRLNLKIAWRNLWKNKGYTFINVIGLSIGMASCILIFIFIRYQMSFDEGFKNEDRIFRVVTDWKYNAYDDYSAGVPIPFSAAARNEITGLEKVGSIIKRGGIISVKDTKGKEKLKSREAVYYAQPDFFEVFSDIKWIYSAPDLALAEPNMVVLTEKNAIKFFGSIKGAIGKAITLENRIGLKVSGIIQDMPQNSSFPLGIIISYETYAGRFNDNWDSVNSSSSSYVLIKAGLKAGDLKESITRFNQKYYPIQKIAGNQTNRLQPLREIHFSEKYDNFADSSINRSEIYGLAVIGLFLIITACINFVNLSTAQSVNRSKEVGVRKVMGSKRKQLVTQFLMETFAVSLVALLIACVITELAIPPMQNLFKGTIEFSLFSHPAIFFFMAILVVFVSFLAGFYPAVIISKFNPALAIKNKISLNNGGLSLRKILVVVQFSITVILIIGTLVIIKQMQYVQEKSLGFNPNAVAMVGIPNDSLSKIKYNTFRERILRIPGVQEMSFCQSPPLSSNINSSDFTYNGIKNEDFELRNMRADESFFKVFDLKLIAGKVFRKSDTANACVVNETFLKKMHILNPEDAIGKIIYASGNTLPIAGVIKDFNDQSLKENISGLAIFPGKDEYWNVAIKMDAEQLVSSMKEVEAVWKSNFPNGIFDSSFVNQSINNYYESEQTMGVLFKVFAGVIIFISFIGLFGLISFVATQRTKEVAIRKVLGASTIELVKMLNGSFLIMVFIANLLAWPLSYLFISKWLSGFAYRIDISIWPFALAMVISMAMTLITVSIRSYKAAAANTIDALKYE